MSCFSVFLAAASSAAPTANKRVRIVHAMKHDLSRPFRDMSAAGGVTDSITAVQDLVIGDAAAGAQAVALKRSFSLIRGFAGMTSSGAFLDADPNGAVGTTQYVQWTNARYAVYDKGTGTRLLAPTSAKLLWTGFGGGCETTNSGDGVALFDKAAQVWVISHHAGAAPFQQCVAISTSSDATGTYNRYAFQLTNQFPDWPKIGVWPDAYYITINLLNPSNYSSLGAEVCALDRTSMIAGRAATAQCFTTGSPSTDYVLMPADLDGATPPPSGAPNYLFSLNVNSLDFYTFHVDWLTPANSVLTGPKNIPVTAFTNGCNGGFCVPQLGTTTLLDAVGERLMYRLAYRNFGDHESLLVNHTINNPVGPGVGVRWYEIRSPGTSPVVYQSGTIQPDTNYRSMASMAMDKMGNILIGYSESGATMNPAIMLTGRLATDPRNILATEGAVIFGTGSQTGTGDYHWGDYSSMTVDPVDDCTLWYTNEFYKTSGTLWTTRIASYKFIGCQ
jgi:hypothetical protein